MGDRQGILSKSRVFHFLFVVWRWPECGRCLLNDDRATTSQKKIIHETRKFYTSSASAPNFESPHLSNKVKSLIKAKVQMNYFFWEVVARPSFKRQRPHSGHLQTTNKKWKTRLLDKIPWLSPTNRYRRLTPYLAKEQSSRVILKNNLF